MSRLPRCNLYGPRSGTASKVHILLVSNDLLGDALVRMPFYAALRKAFPSSKYHIAVSLNPPVANLLSRLPYFDEVISAEHLHVSHPILWLFNRHWIINNILRWSFLHKIDILINPIRRRSLGCDYLLSLSQPNISIAYTSDSMKDLFPATQAYQKKHCDKLYTFRIKDALETSQIESMQNILDFTAHKHIQLSPVPIEEISLLFPTLKSPPPHPYCVFVPGASSQFRQWPPKRFAKVANHLLLTKKNLTIILVGTKDEWPIGEEIKNDTDERVINWCGNTSLAELGTLLKDSSLVLTNETGTATYAAIVSAPTLCLVGGGDFNAFFPNDFYKNTRCLYHFDDCFHCKWKCRKNQEQSKVAPCILRITEDEVCDLADKMLESNVREGC